MEHGDHGGQRLHFVDYFLKVHSVAQGVAQLPCNFCLICSFPSRIGQTVEQENQNQHNLVADHHGQPEECLAMDKLEN